MLLARTGSLHQGDFISVYGAIRDRAGHNSENEPCKPCLISEPEIVAALRSAGVHCWRH